MVNNGAIIPRPASPESSEKSPSPITMKPADLKKRGAYLDFAKETEPNETRARTGNVPRANESIMSEPETNNPLESADICID